tara:strand:+ start:359 stop:994 length:636 start_codon:yes stop_codon:yes gene_type:complete
MNWAFRSADNILPLSKDQKNLLLALKEWVYTGEMYDLEAPNETCQLCDHPNIRYQFNIRNTHNHNELLVGSECINKFEIKAVDESGALLNVIESRRKVNRDKRHLVSEASKKRLINALVELLKKDDEFEIENFINYVQERGAFTPLQLSTLVWRLNEKGVRHNPLDFTLIMRRNREKDQLRAMPDWKIRKIWDYLSSPQKEWVIDNARFKL